MQPNKNNADEPQTTQLPPNRSAFEVVPLSTSIESVPELLANFRALNDEQLKANLGPIVTLYEAAFKEYGITREELMSFLIYLVRFSDPVQYPAISKYAYRTFDYFKRDVNRFVPMKGIETLIIVYNRILQTPLGYVGAASELDMPNFLFKPSGDIAEDIRKESLIELMVSAINGSPELVMEHDFLLEMQKISDFVNQGFEEIKKRYFSSSARRAIYTVIANYSDARVCVFLNYHLNENEYLALNIEDLVKLGDEISKINKPAASEVWKKHFRIFYDIAKTKDLTTYLTHIKDMPVHLLIEYLTPLPPKFEHLKDYNITTMQCMEFLLFLVNHSDPKSYPHISQYAKWVFNCFKNNDGSKYAQGMLLAACNRMIKECGDIMKN